jgi:mRNA interferase RelE/StbE
MSYEVVFTAEAKDNLDEIRDRRVRAALYERAMELAVEPELQGKPLGKQLKGFRSVRAVGQRYRIVYEVRNMQVLVVIISVGLRKEGSDKDVYEQLKKQLGKKGRPE